MRISLEIILALTFTYNHPENETSQGYYALIGFFSIAGNVTSNMSLQWVPYLTQIIAKCESSN